MKNKAFGHNLEHYPVEEDGSRRLHRSTRYTDDGHTRGVTRTLHQMPDDTLQLTTETWSHWKGEETAVEIETLPWDVFGPGGEFEPGLGGPPNPDARPEITGAPMLYGDSVIG